MNGQTVRVACGASLITGLLFVFVWAPHPWGWAGFDQYYDLGRLLARSTPFPTTDVPWGYAYFLAPFYRVFGDRPWIPLTVQVVLNALMPALTYRIARQLFDERTAIVAALLVGFMSFNTVYASTQSSDAVCNVLFMAAVLVFVRARARDNSALFLGAGALFGIAPQFRPNLILIPPLLALFRTIEARSLRAARQGALVVAASALMLAPWVVRNYRLTGEILPTSTHGGVQFWYGTLQTGPYLHSRAHNPRAAFERAPFQYTSLDRVPLVVTGRLAPCAESRGAAARVMFWTDRDPQRRFAPLEPSDNHQRFQATLPASPAPTTYYYLVDGLEPWASPHVFFVSTDHFGDLDAHGDLLDVFDVIRLIRHAAWNEKVVQADRLDLDQDGVLTIADAAAATRTLLREADPLRAPDQAPTFEHGALTARLAFADGSTIVVPKDWNGRITDVTFSGPVAEAILSTIVPFSRLSAGDNHSVASGDCHAIAEIAINDVFYRLEPHAMRRYTALALDNIRRDPFAYLASVGYRAARVFFIEGSDDPHTTQQFAGGGRIYRAAFLISIALLVVAIVGMWLAWRRGASLALPLVLIAYIPATLAFVLTNMRYSITVQPLLMMFVAVAVVTAWERSAGSRPRAQESAMSTPYRADTQTARRP